VSPGVLARLLALAAGALSVFAFAPFHAVPLGVASLVTLFWLWQRAATARDGALVGFAFGLGMFGAGVSWVFVALETFGGMPMPVAIVSTAGFVAYLALWPALAGFVVARATRPESLARLVAAAAAWTLTEWLRGTVLSGFAWQAIGYPEILPGGALPLAGYAPVGGVALVSLAAAGCAAAAVAAIDGLASARRRRVMGAILVGVGLVTVGAFLQRIEWTVPAGEPVSISLVQGNVAQAQKFDPAFRATNIERYIEMIEAARGRIVVLPESAFPQFADEIPPEVFRRIADLGRARDGAVLVGLFVAEPPAAPGEGERIHNSVVSLGAAPPQLYRKHHLVPFGETIPFKPVTGWFINQVLAIPLADQAAGPAMQAPFAVAGQRIAVNICYEDVFGSELLAAARASTMLVNVTNDAWYGRSIAARQHNQIAAMRALETGRPMLRATNTGITSAIAHDGRVLAEMPWFTRGILEVEIAGRTGDTPYARAGDWPVVLLCAALLALAIARDGRVFARGNR
jgi:apolipoprotein N-acyltransferase